MIEPASLQKMLSRSFCEKIVVRHVPMGLAISSPFKDNSGDRISFYIRENGESYRFEDDGEFIPDLIASGIDMEKGQRRQLLDGILAESNAYLDEDTFEIHSHSTSSPSIGDQSVRFLSALIRIRDLKLLTKEMVRSTFKEDAAQALKERFSETFLIENNAPLSPSFSDYPADLVMHSRSGGKSAAVFFVNSTTQFLEAELLHGEIERSNYRNKYASIALMEDNDKITAIGTRRFARALNRGLPTPVFRGDEDAALKRISDLVA